uniref:G_PROTEIN_RECEP_F1_2 domain-containing protein n=1 Tax=Rhabditophanes sp. KR3021 TaxID=114890 RepID=A0AC35TGT9_9BILA
MELQSPVDYSNTDIYKIRTFIDISLDITFFIGLILNLLLFFLCFRIKQKEFVPYKTIIYLAVITDLIFLFSTLISINLDISDEMGHILSINKRLCLLKFGYLILINIIWHGLNTIIWSYGTTSKDSENNKLIEEKLSIEYFYRTDGYLIKYYPLRVFNPFGMVALIHVIITTSIIMIGETWMFLQIWKQLKINLNIMSTKTKQIQGQLNLLMIFNATTAICSSVFPCSFIVMCAVFNVNLYGQGNYCYILFVWVTLLNPLASIIFIKPCRNELMKMLGCGLMIKQPASTTKITI